MMLAMVGSDPQTGTLRWTMGQIFYSGKVYRWCR